MTPPSATGESPAATAAVLLLLLLVHLSLLPPLLLLTPSPSERFNGPSFLTWSRGQNEYGSKIAGPLPRSWMKGHHTLQQNIVKRYRALGMAGQLPAFQGNVPVALKYSQNDKNMTPTHGASAAATPPPTAAAARARTISPAPPALRMLVLLLTLFPSVFKAASFPSA